VVEINSTGFTLWPRVDSQVPAAKHVDSCETLRDKFFLLDVFNLYFNFVQRIFEEPIDSSEAIQVYILNPREIKNKMSSHFIYAYFFAHCLRVELLFFILSQKYEDLN